MSEPTNPFAGNIDFNAMLAALQAQGVIPTQTAATTVAPEATPEPPKVPGPDFPTAPEPLMPPEPPVKSDKPAVSPQQEERDPADNQPKETKSVADAPAPEPKNPIAEHVMEQQQAKLSEKMPYFQFKNASEQLEDDNMTFDQLRELKSSDFLVLEEAKSVTWTVTYGKVVRKVPDTKISIRTFKREIEASKDFKEGLKSSKDKSPNCVLTPTVTMKTKGTAMAGYKGLFQTLDEARASDKVICLVPDSDGTLHRLCKAPMGELITPAHDFREADAVEAGFTPAFPRVPRALFAQILGFFRHFTYEGTEVMVQVFWDKADERYIVYVPQQEVNGTAIFADLDTEDYPGIDGRYVLCMDIHSHNSMHAFFSNRDDRDERDDGVYLVVGRLDQYFPEIKARICNGGVFADIPPDVVLESIEEEFPDDWLLPVRITADTEKKSEVNDHEVFDDSPREDRDAGCRWDGRPCCAAFIPSAIRTLLYEEGKATDY